MPERRRRGTVLVPTRPIPRFRILSDLEGRAEKDANRNLRQAIREIQEAVLAAPPDPAEQALVEAAAMARSLGIPDQRILELIGADLEKMVQGFEVLCRSAEAGSPGLFHPNDPEVSLEERRSRAEICYEIRKRSDAPVDPAGWLAEREDEEADRLLSFVPFRMGRLVASRVGARDLPPRYRQGREPDRMAVALVDEFHLNVNVKAQLMRSILKGEALAQVPEVVRHPLADGMDPVYSVITGGETFLLALWAGLPALEMDVWAPEKAVPAQPTMLPAVEDMEELNRLMFEKFAVHQYRVPPALEPVAKLARMLARYRFLTRFAGRPDAEEIEARQAADLANATRTAIWVSLARAARAAGSTAEGARRRAEKSPEWKRATSAWRRLERKAVRLEEEGHRGREEMRVAKAEALNLAEQLDLALSGPGVRDDFTLWLEARHGRFDSDELDQPAGPGEHPAAQARRLPNNVSERRHPNLHEYDGAPGVFTLVAGGIPEPEVEADGTQEIYGVGTYEAVPEAYRYPAGEPVLVTAVDPESGQLEPDAEAVEPALVVSTRG